MGGVSPEPVASFVVLGVALGAAVPPGILASRSLGGDNPPGGGGGGEGGAA